MMNGNEDDVDLGLTLGYPSSCTRTRLSNNSGAGVNAGPSVDMTFAASDPLSELVWSPHKGLSLKRADCTKTDKNPFLLWNVGSSNIVPSPSQSIRFRETDEEKIVDGNLILAHATLFQDKVAQEANFSQSTDNSSGPVIKTGHGANIESVDKSEDKNVEEEGLPKHISLDKGKIVDDDDDDDDDDDEECSPQGVQMADMTDGSQRNTGQSIQNAFVQGNGEYIHDTVVKFSTNCGNTTNMVAGGSQILAGVTTTSEVHAEMKRDETTNEAILAREEEKKKMINVISFKFPSSGVVEGTAENDLHDLNTEEAYWLSEERLPGGSYVPLGTSPINGNQRRVKRKALSDGNFSKGFSNGEDDSHESVESCNSAGLLSKGKRQFKYEENLVFESKRLKRSDRSSVSASSVKNDSSFMNWISNIVKGYGKSNEEEDPSLAHALDDANPKHASFLEETMICSEQHDCVSRNMGFQNIFQSLYSQNTKLIEARVSRDDCSLEESRGILQAERNNTTNSSNSCTRQNGLSCENFMPNDKTIPMPDAEIHSGLPHVFSATVPVQVDSVAELAENKASISLQCNGDRDRIDPSESLGMRMITRVNNENPDFASEGRRVIDMSNKSNLFGSLWISRLSPKTGSSTLNLDQSKQVSNFCQTWEYPGRKAVSSQIQKNPNLAMKHKSSEGRDSSNETSSGFLVKELQMFASNAECSVGFKEIHSHNQQNTVFKLPSQTLKRSEAIASVFARRLDAFKHITPSGSNNEATCAAVTCFFCGKSGHSLGDCSEVTKAELDHLLRNISSYLGADCPCLCIRCFQLDHWAAACPRGSSSRQQHVEENTFFSFGNFQLLPIDERTSQFFEKEEHDRGTVFTGEKSYTYKNNINPVISGDPMVRRSSSSYESQKQRTSNFWENSAGGYHDLHLSNLVSTHVINIPKGIFDAARRLQVYRADIIKLMKSHVLMPHLEGFFLRLRLGKWEAGLGGTGYYVGCIAGQAGKAVKDLKKSVSVNVGGIKCQVGSQYVSNEDFLEDEFKTWWCRTQRSRGKLPMKDELESKFKLRMNLGI